MSPMGTGTPSCAPRRGPSAKALLRPLGLASLGLGLLLVVLSSVTATAHASTIDGNAVISDPSTNAAITAPNQPGGLNFTIVLPPQAACDGDTATGGYHVYSYVINGPLTAAALATYMQALNPFTGSPTQYFPLTDNGGNFYGPANTAIGTGQITQIPLDLDFQPLDEALTSHQLPGLAGTTKEVGILCATSGNVVKDFWNQEVTFATSASDPSGFTWTAGASGSGGGTTTTTSTTTASSTTSTTTADTTTTSSTVDDSTTSSTTGTDTGTSTTVATDTGSGGDGSSTGDPSSSSGSSAQLAATGSSIKPELNAGVVLIGLGALMLVAIPSRRAAPARIRHRRR